MKNRRFLKLLYVLMIISFVSSLIMPFSNNVIEAANFSTEQEFKDYLNQYGMQYYSPLVGKNAIREVFNKYDLLVYGDKPFGDVKCINTSTDKEQPTGCSGINTSNPYASNVEYRYLGYMYNGTNYSNPRFPPDVLGGNAPENWKYLDNVPGASDSWREVNIYLKKYIRETKLTGNGAKTLTVNTMKDFNGNYVGNRYPSFVRVQSTPSWASGGSIYTMNKGGDGTTYYADFTLPPMLDVFVKGTLTTDKDKYVIEEGQAEVTVPITVTANANLTPYVTPQQVKVIKAGYDSNIYIGSCQTGRWCTTASQTGKVVHQTTTSLSRTTYTPGTHQVKLEGIVYIESTLSDGDKQAVKVSKTVTLEVKPQVSADLIAENISNTSPIQVGTSTPFEATFYNSKAVDKDIIVRISEKGASGYLKQQAFTAADLGVNKELMINFNFTFTAPGSKTFVLDVDAANDIQETNETNNKKEFTFSADAKPSITGDFDILPSQTIAYHDSFTLHPKDITVGGGCSYVSHKFRIERDGYMYTTPETPGKSTDISFTQSNYPYVIGVGIHQVSMQIKATCGTSDWIGPKTLEVTGPKDNRPPDFQIGFVHPYDNKVPLNQVVQGEILDLIYIFDPSVPTPSDPDGDSIYFDGFDFSDSDVWTQSIPAHSDAYIDGYHTITMNELGYHQVRATMHDPYGGVTTKTTGIFVVPPNPVAVIDGPTETVEHRPLTSPFNGDRSYSPIGRKIDHTKDIWTNKKDVYDNVGTETVTLEVTDDQGMKSVKPAEHQIIVKPDLPPIPQLEFFETAIRTTTVAFRNTSYSPDRDNLVQNKVSWKYDSDNDGSFTDETTTAISMDAQNSFNFKPSKVGKYEFTVYVQEDWGKDAAKSFILTCINDAPYVSFRMTSDMAEPVPIVKKALTAAQITNPANGWKNSDLYSADKASRWAANPNTGALDISSDEKSAISGYYSDPSYNFDNTEFRVGDLTSASFKEINSGYYHSPKINTYTACSGGSRPIYLRDDIHIAQYSSSCRYATGGEYSHDESITVFRGAIPYGSSATPIAGYTRQGFYAYNRLTDIIYVVDYENRSYSNGKYIGVRLSDYLNGNIANPVFVSDGYPTGSVFGDAFDYTYGYRGSSYYLSSGLNDFKTDFPKYINSEYKRVSFDGTSVTGNDSISPIRNGNNNNIVLSLNNGDQVTLTSVYTGGVYKYFLRVYDGTSFALKKEFPFDNYYSGMYFFGSYDGKYLYYNNGGYLVKFNLSDGTTTKIPFNYYPSFIGMYKNKILFTDSNQYTGGQVIWILDTNTGNVVTRTNPYSNYSQGWSSNFNSSVVSLDGVLYGTAGKSGGDFFVFGYDLMNDQYFRTPTVTLHKNPYSSSSSCTVSSGSTTSGAVIPIGDGEFEIYQEYSESCTSDNYYTYYMYSVKMNQNSEKSSRYQDQLISPSTMENGTIEYTARMNLTFPDSNYVGFGFGVQDNRNMYRVEQNSNKLRLVKMVDGIRTVLKEGTYKPTVHAYSSYKINVLDNRIRVYVQGVPLLDVTDADYSGGKYGPFSEVPRTEFKDMFITDMGGGETTSKIPNVALVGSQVDYTSDVADTENDPTIPDRRAWKYEQISQKFLNAGDGYSGVSAFNNKTVQNPYAQLDKVGYYRVSLTETDDPHPGHRYPDAMFDEYRQKSNTAVNYLTVHRRPVARFTIAANPDGSLKWSDTSYDPDRWLSATNYSTEATGIDYQRTRGILERKYFYTSPSGKTAEEMLVSPDEIGTYSIGLSVKDEYGAWSEWAIQEFTTTKTAPKDDPPVPGFELGRILTYRGSPVNVTSTAYDKEDGAADRLPHEYYARNANADQPERMVSTNRGLWQQTFTELGTYEIRQVVTDSKGQSAQIAKTVEVLNRKPEAAITSPGSQDQTVPEEIHTVTPVFKWTYSDGDSDPQKKFNVRIFKYGGILLVDSGRLTSDVQAWQCSTTLPENQKLYATVSVFDGFEWSEVSPRMHFYIDTNRAPLAEFDWSPKPVWEGDNVTLINASTDPDGDELSFHWEMTTPDAKNEDSTEKEWSRLFSLPGVYKVKLSVSDGKKESTVTKTIVASPLTIQGVVNHTQDWLEYHIKAGDEVANPPKDFYSGEKLLLAVKSSPAAVDKVTAWIDTNGLDGERLFTSAELKMSDSPSQWEAEMWDDRWMSLTEGLPKGLQTVHFQIRYGNGTIRTTTVNIRIIGHAKEIVGVHRRQ